MRTSPLYIETALDGALEERIAELDSLTRPCILCPRKCMVERAESELGFCRAPYDVYVSSAFPHFGEEKELSGINGSGTVFFSHCNLRCAFCQNYEISIRGEGSRCSSGELAAVMVDLQQRGCHNINLVTPTHYVPQIMKALSRAIGMGLSVPLVYNCSGYESLEVIRLLDGIIDIYMPDFKFMSGELSQRFCRAPDYAQVLQPVLKEMQRQVGDLVTDENGIARRGLLIRHLVMPSCAEDTRNILRLIRDELSEQTHVNIMAQYHPCHRADEFEELSRRPTASECLEALDFARAIGLKRAFIH
jgi:putative pyruvate formate lyase activating enzyme